jgi:hypothetical protein
MIAICEDSCPYVTEHQVLLGRYVDDYSRIASVLHYSSGYRRVLVTPMGALPILFVTNNSHGTARVLPIRR